MAKRGRPTKYSSEMLEKAQDYLENYNTKYNDEVPSIKSLARALRVHRDTLYEWANEKEHKEFSDTLTDIDNEQYKVLLSKGLNGKFNSSFAKLVMYNHGHSEKSETTHDVSDPVKELFRQVAEDGNLLVPYERSEPED